MAVRGLGCPVRFTLTAGQKGDAPQAAALIEGYLPRLSWPIQPMTPITGLLPSPAFGPKIEAVVQVAITTRKVNWILDADVQNFFGSVSQDWLVQFLEHRIGDKRIIRLILAPGHLRQGGTRRHPQQPLTCAQ